MKYTLFLLFSVIGILGLLVGCTSEKPRFVIGVSQCSDDEWREQTNKEIRREALFYPEVEVKIRSVKDDNVAQEKDIDRFIDEGVDLLIVAPNEADALVPAIERAYDAGIPVVLFDRKVHSDKYTAYVGADNYEIGYQVGEYIVSRLQGKGQIVELTGLIGSSPAVERHRGMMKALQQAPDIHVLASVDAAWLRESAEKVFDSIQTVYPHIDLVFAHNDRMAVGAYDAAVGKKRDKDILFVGIDALAGKGNGVEQVMAGHLDASFIYPTGGDRVMQVAMNILEGKPYTHDSKLSTALVNRSNARIMQMQTEHIFQLDSKIEVLDSKLDAFLLRYSAQQMFLYACIVILILVCTLLFFVVRAFWTKNRLNTELSEQKRHVEEQRDQLINLSKELEKATHAKLAFFTNVSHDFRTPLTLISDPVDQLAESKNLNDHERFLLNIIRKNVTVLLRLINQILDFRKFENGKLHLHLSEFDISQGIHEWTEAFRTLSYRKHIHFNVTVEPESAGYLMIADAEKMERITYNLLSNAFKFTPENGKIEVKLSRFDRNGEGWLCFQVSDTGMGMPAEHVQHIFESFYQIDVHHAGSGIGLALVKAFVEMHKGTIRVKSAEGKGTLFTVEVPMKQAGTLEKGLEKNAIMDNLKEGAVLAADQEGGKIVAEKVPDESRETVLVIDDNQDVRDYVKMLLEDQYAVIEATNGQEGLKQAMKYVPDIIICDVMMPVMDGMECCCRLKSEVQTSHIPVLMLTAYTMDEQKVKGYECGADSYMLKPFSAKLLLTRLRNLLDNRKRLQNFFGDKGGLKKESIAEPDKDFLAKLYSLIDGSLSDPDLSVEDLGGKIGMSRVQLYRKTKALTGYSPNELLRIARLKKAAALLASTDKTIAEIAYEVGFSAPSYFAKCYKEYFGENPTDFLKRKG